VSPELRERIIERVIDDLPQILFGLLYTFAYFVMLFGIMAGWFTVPERSSLFSGVIGSLTTAQGLVLSFFYGTAMKIRKAGES
jgi:hypothetical protein